MSESTPNMPVACRLTRFEIIGRTTEEGTDALLYKTTIMEGTSVPPTVGQNWRMELPEKKGSFSVGWIRTVEWQSPVLKGSKRPVCVFHAGSDFYRWDRIDE